MKMPLADADTESKGHYGRDVAAALELLAERHGKRMLVGPIQAPSLHAAAPHGEPAI